MNAPTGTATLVEHKRLTHANGGSGEVNPV
jgi:hypothetical protein